MHLPDFVQGKLPEGPPGLSTIKANALAQILQNLLDSQRMFSHSQRGILSPWEPLSVLPIGSPDPLGTSESADSKESPNSGLNRGSKPSKSSNLHLDEI